jgi:mRNA interferase MazF
MGRFVKGDVVVVPFPFSDLTGHKRRPAFVIANLPGDDLIVCQITSQYKSDPWALPLAKSDFLTGHLPVDSFIRPNKIFTASQSLILYAAGHLSRTKVNEITSAVINIIS